MRELSADMSLFRAYCEGRRAFLDAIGCGDSYRDPLSEFSERLVCQQLGGKLAPSRVQKGYDFISIEERRVQVSYLANPPGRWRNEHTITFTTERDDYAVVFFEGLDLQAVIVFRRETIEPVCRRLGKKHTDKLQLTQPNFKRLLRESDEFEQLGVVCFRAQQPICSSMSDDTA